jgi:hypothetical protein
MFQRIVEEAVIGVLTELLQRLIDTAITYGGTVPWSIGLQVVVKWWVGL